MRYTKKWSLLLAFSVSFQIAIGCSIICNIPDKFNTNVYILEGEVVGYIGDFYKPEIQGKIGGFIINVTNAVYPNRKIKTINLFMFNLGSDCSTLGISKESLAHQTPLGTFVTFVGGPFQLEEVNGLNLSNHVCTPIFYSRINTKSSFNYEKERKKHLSLMKKIQLNKNAREVSILDRIKKQHIEKEHEKWEKKGERKYPEHFQTYLDLLKIHKTKSEIRRYRMLRKLIWSQYVYKSTFIDGQEINDRRKNKLKNLFKKINKEWSY